MRISSSSSLSSLSLTSSSLQRTETIPGEIRGTTELDVVCVEVERVNDEVTEGGEDTATGGADNVEHTVAVPAVVEGEGKNTPFGRGRGRTGFAALPTTLPTPGKFFLAVGATAEDSSGLAAVAAFAAWYLAALVLSRAFLAGPRLLAAAL